jgi:hypothetical protein
MNRRASYFLVLVRCEVGVLNHDGDARTWAGTRDLTSDGAQGIIPLLVKVNDHATASPAHIEYMMCANEKMTHCPHQPTVTRGPDRSPALQSARPIATRMLFMNETRVKSSVKIIRGPNVTSFITCTICPSLPLDFVVGYLYVMLTLNSTAHSI